MHFLLLTGALKGFLFEKVSRYKILLNHGSGYPRGKSISSFSDGVLNTHNIVCYLSHCHHNEKDNKCGMEKRIKSRYTNGKSVSGALLDPGRFVTSNLGLFKVTT